MLWSFMGASLAYTICGGICEVVGGTLLLLRRTTTLGAMVSFGVLLNIALLNSANPDSDLSGCAASCRSTDKSGSWRTRADLEVRPTC
jgi:uncharacterized membrane protein YphA (DoxX/SURF4 family)